MPPVHPAIVHYPIALVTLSVVADLFGFNFGSQSLQHAGWWALLGAGMGAAAALVAGLFDMHREKLQPAAHQRVHTHMKVGLTLFALLAALTIWRWSIYAGVSDGVGRLYLTGARDAVCERSILCRSARESRFRRQTDAAMSLFSLNDREFGLPFHMEENQ